MRPKTHGETPRKKDRKEKEKEKKREEPETHDKKPTKEPSLKGEPALPPPALPQQSSSSSFFFPTTLPSVEIHLNGHGKHHTTWGPGPEQPANHSGGASPDDSSYGRAESNF